MLFEPALYSVIQEGLKLFPALVNVPPGASKTVRIPVCKSSKHDILLSARTVLGRMEEIMDSRPVNLSSSSQQSAKPNSVTNVYTMQVSPNSDTQQSLTHKKSGILQSI